MTDAQIINTQTAIKLKRPKIVGGITIKTVTGCGNMYVQLGWCYGHLFEIFATLGAGGECAMCYSGALTKSVTLGLRSGVPPEEYIKQLRGIRCPNPHPFPKDEAVMSCPDAIARVIEQYGSLSTEDMIELILGTINPEFKEAVPPPENEAEEAANALKQLEEQRQQREIIEGNVDK